MAITARYIASLEEVRLYKDNGHYWPIKFKGDPECAKGFIEFMNGESPERIDCDCLATGYVDHETGSVFYK